MTRGQKLSARSKPKDTAIAQAFAKASGKTGVERLTEIAVEALVENASKPDYTTQAIEQIWQKVQKDSDLLIALFNQFGEYRQAIGRVLHRIKIDISYEASKSKLVSDKDRKILKIVQLERDEEKRERADQLAADRAEQARKDAEYRDYLASWNKTPLFDVTIGGCPIWEVSAGTVRAWLPTQQKKLRAIEMMLDGIPDDGRPIGYYLQPADFMAIWKIVGQDE